VRSLPGTLAGTQWRFNGEVAVVAHWPGHEPYYVLVARAHWQANWDLLVAWRAQW
jgi:hypothetical protein